MPSEPLSSRPPVYYLAYCMGYLPAASVEWASGLGAAALGGVYMSLRTLFSPQETDQSYDRVVGIVALSWILLGFLHFAGKRLCGSSSDYFNGAHAAANPYLSLTPARKSREWSMGYAAAHVDLLARRGLRGAAIGSFALIEHFSNPAIWTKKSSYHLSIILLPIAMLSMLHWWADNAFNRGWLQSKKYWRTRNYFEGARRVRNPKSQPPSADHMGFFFALGVLLSGTEAFFGDGMKTAAVGGLFAAIELSGCEVAPQTQLVVAATTWALLVLSLASWLLSFPSCATACFEGFKAARQPGGLDTPEPVQKWCWQFWCTACPSESAPGYDALPEDNPSNGFG